MSVILAWLGRPLRVSRIKTRLNTRSAGNNLSCRKGKLTRKRFVSSFSVNQTGFDDNFCTCRLRRARAGRSIFSMWWVQGTPTTLLLQLCSLNPRIMCGSLTSNNYWHEYWISYTLWNQLHGLVRRRKNRDPWLRRAITGSLQCILQLKNVLGLSLIYNRSVHNTS